MKYLVKQIFEEVVELVEGVEVITQTNNVLQYIIKNQTTASALPRGGSFIFVEGVATKYPKLQIDEVGNMSIIEDSILKSTSERKATRKNNGKIARSICESVLDMVAGYNVENDFTAEQITQMEVDFTTIVLLLRANRPNTAKQLIELLVVDELVITQELKDDILDEMRDF